MAKKCEWVSQAIEHHNFARLQDGLSAVKTLTDEQVAAEAFLATLGKQLAQTNDVYSSRGA